MKFRIYVNASSHTFSPTHLFSSKTPPSLSLSYELMSSSSSLCPPSHPFNARVTPLPSHTCHVLSFSLLLHIPPRLSSHSFPFPLFPFSPSLSLFPFAQILSLVFYHYSLFLFISTFNYFFLFCFLLRIL